MQRCSSLPSILDEKSKFPQQCSQQHNTITTSDDTKVLSISIHGNSPRSTGGAAWGDTIDVFQLIDNNDIKELTNIFSNGHYITTTTADKHAILSQTHTNGLMPIQYAVWKGHSVELITILINAALSLSLVRPLIVATTTTTSSNVMNNNDTTHAAISTIQSLFTISAGQSQQQQHGLSTGSTLYHIAIQQQHYHIVELLSTQYHHSTNTFVLYINGKDALGMTPLMLAASNGDLTGVRLLIKHGAAIAIEASHNIDVLYFATASGNIELIDYLINEQPLLIDYHNRSNLFSIAIQNGNKFVFEHLLQYIELPQSTWGPLLNDAVHIQDDKFVDYLINTVFNKHLLCIQHAFLAACGLNSVAVIKVLIDTGMVDITECNGFYQNAFHCATTATATNVEVLQYLLDQFTQLSLQRQLSKIDPTLLSPIQQQQQQPIVDISQYIEHRSTYDETRLVRACRFGKLDHVKLL